MIKKYLFYLFRWQLSTPILAIVLIWLAPFPTLVGTIVANLIGGLIFFWVDRIIFSKKRATNPRWELRPVNKCIDCGAVDIGFRVVEWEKYDRTGDKTPQWRCYDCAQIKLNKIRGK